MKRFRGIKLAFATTALMAAFALNAQAGYWAQNTTGWWYDWGNGTWPASSWQWIDGNSDGIAECYYFDRFGYCMINATTPDNYQVNASGAWVENGVVQTREVGVSKSSNSIKADNPTVVTSKTKKKKKEKAEKDEQEEKQKAQEQETQEQRAETQKTTQYSGKYLYDMNPILRDDIGYYDSLVTNKENKTVTRALKSNGSGYVEYVAGKKYTKFKATVATVEDGSWYESPRMVLQVMGDGAELYVSPDIYYNTDMFDIEVDISGYDIIRLNVLTVSSYAANVALVNARFE
jgi:cysteine-rich secretory protein family./putative cell wall binding repeat